MGKATDSSGMMKEGREKNIGAQSQQRHKKNPQFPFGGCFYKRYWSASVSWKFQFGQSFRESNYPQRMNIAHTHTHTHYGPRRKKNLVNTKESIFTKTKDYIDHITSLDLSATELLKEIFGPLLVIVGNETKTDCRSVLVNAPLVYESSIDTSACILAAPFRVYYSTFCSCTSTSSPNGILRRTEKFTRWVVDDVRRI